MVQVLLPLATRLISVSGYPNFEIIIDLQGFTPSALFLLLSTLFLFLLLSTLFLNPDDIKINQNKKKLTENIRNRPDHVRK